jgi:hypothetical protein
MRALLVAKGDDFSPWMIASLQIRVMIRMIPQIAMRLANHSTAFSIPLAF